jgi:hypothetical protein
MSTPPSWPLDSREHLDAALREQDATPGHIDAWAPVVQRLADWPERRVTLADTQRLLAALAPLVPARSAVREAIQVHYARRRAGIAWMLDTARAQVSILRPSFWLVSVAVTVLCAYLELAPWENVDAVLFLRATAPLLAFLSITAMFRGAGLRMLECEIACPPTALQLAIARLVIVLGYDIGLGLCLGLALWLHGVPGAPGEVSFLALTLHWLTPLLLVAGLALVLSLRLPAALASGIAYACWLAGLGLFYSFASSLAPAGAYPAAALPTLPLGVEVALGLAGVALLSLGTLRFPNSVTRMLPDV